MSFGRECGRKDAFGVYVKVSSFVDWIWETIINNAPTIKPDLMFVPAINKYRYKHNQSLTVNATCPDGARLSFKFLMFQTEKNLDNLTLTFDNKGEFFCFSNTN